MSTTCFLNNALSSQSLRRVIAAILVLGGLCAAAQPAWAIVVVNDTWKDGTDTDPDPANGYSEYKVDIDGDGDIESAWFQGGEGTLNPFDTGGGVFVQRGNILGDDTPSTTASSSWTTHFTPEGSEINLAGDQDAIKLTWTFSLTNVNATNGSQNFRIALVDTPDGTRNTMNGSVPSGAYRGYALFANMGVTLGHPNPLRLMRRNVDSGDILGASGNWLGIGTTGATNGNHGYDPATNYTLTWLITRDASNNLIHDVQMAGGTLDNDGLAQVLFTDTTVVDEALGGPRGSYKFDTFGIRPSSAASTAEIFDTKLFKVEFLSTSTPVLNGDFNNDGKVDAADYNIWRENLSTNNTLPNSNNLPGPVGQAHYDLWKSNFGKPPGAGAGSGIMAAGVPEPASMLFALCGCAAAMFWRRRASIG